MNIAAVEQYLNNLLSVINDDKNDFYHREDANQQLLSICRFLKTIMPNYMTPMLEHDILERSKFAIILPPIEENIENEEEKKE